jgi:hypothetical protein
VSVPRDKGVGGEETPYRGISGVFHRSCVGWAGGFLILNLSRLAFT